MIAIANPRVEYRTRPLAVEHARPRFSWELQSATRGMLQTSYRLEVQCGDTRWDSGIVHSRETAQIEYDGPVLPGGSVVMWRVAVTATDGSTAVAESSFETAPLVLWWEKADWITRRRPQDQHDDHRPTPYMRTTIRGGDDVERARLHATAGGLMELWIQGERLDTSSLLPGWTDYNHRVPYHSYDVTSFFAAEDVTLGAVVADGWYAGGAGPFHKRNFWGKHPVLKAILVVERADGTREIHGTDESWEGSFGPIQSADLLQGVVIDARVDTRDWSTGRGAWGTTSVEVGPSGQLVPAVIDGAGPVAELSPVTITEPFPGSHVVDFGQNIAGWVRLEISGPPGLIVRVRHAEVLHQDGRIYTENLRGARATDTYILSGGDDVFEPRFTYHGFRYAEITGPVDGVTWSATSVAVSSIPEMTGHVRTGNALVNRLQENIQWSMFSNFIEVPTDCPSRDERIGWTGDGQVFANTATANADVASFFSKWLADIDDTRLDNGSLPDIAPAVVLERTLEGSSGYAEAGLVVPWALHREYGDTRILERFFDIAVGWVGYVRARSPDLIWREDRNIDYGDWLAPEDTPKDLTATAYFARSAQLVAQFATVLGRDEEARRFGELHAQIAEAFRKEFVTGDGEVVPGTQTAYSLALAFDLLRPEQRPVAGRGLARNVERHGHVTTGFLAVAHILPVLTAIGRSDLAYSLLLNDQYPSWGHEVRSGATTIWERWDGWRPETGFQDALMNSFNHFAFGSVGEWIVNQAAGLKTGEPGYRHVVVAPQVDGRLGFVEASHRSIRGLVTTSWRLAGRRLVVEVGLPANVTGTVRIPAKDVVERDGGGSMTQGVQTTTIEIGSGAYCFEGEFVPFE